MKPVHSSTILCFNPLLIVFVLSLICFRAPHVGAFPGADDPVSAAASSSPLRSFEQEHFSHVGDQETYVRSQFRELSASGEGSPLQEFLTKTGLKEYVIRALLETANLGIESTRAGDEIITRFVPTFERISPNQEGQEAIDQELAAFDEGFGTYRGAGQTFADSVTQIYRNLYTQNSGMKNSFNQQRLLAVEPAAQASTALDIFLSQEGMTAFVNRFVPPLAAQVSPDGAEVVQSIAEVFSARLVAEAARAEGNAAATDGPLSGDPSQSTPLPASLSPFPNSPFSQSQVP